LLIDARTPARPPSGAASDADTPANPAVALQLQIEHAAECVRILGREAPSRKGDALGEKRIDRAAKTTGRGFVAVRMVDDDAVQRDARFADVATTNEQPGTFIDADDAWRRRHGPHQIRLRAGGADDVDRAEDGPRIGRRRHRRRPHGDGR
jgi:hypothetical protein